MSSVLFVDEKYESLVEILALATGTARDVATTSPSIRNLIH